MDLADPTFDDVLAAQVRLRGRVHCTPVFHSETFDRLCGAEVHFKCENLQRVGAFKARGAMNAVQSLPEADAALGVVTHSSGNHGAALALAARERGIPADVVVPKGTARVKVDAIRRYGARLHECEPTLAARELLAHEIVTRTGGTLVHPFDDPRVIAGQATATLELMAAVPELGVLIAPVSGGGLLSGSALAGHLHAKDQKVRCQALQADRHRQAVAPFARDPAHRQHKVLQAKTAPRQSQGSVSNAYTAAQALSAPRSLTVCCASHQPRQAGDHPSRPAGD
jgi:threonine dehydratase